MWTLAHAPLVACAHLAALAGPPRPRAHHGPAECPPAEAPDGPLLHDGLDAAAQPGMAREASALFDIYDAEADPQLSVQMLQCFESLGDWRAALALPAAAPSAATFTAALTHYCSPRRWSIVAEARGGSRAERRAAALRRWLDGARARDATDAERSAARAALPGGVASRLAYEQLGGEGLEKAAALRKRRAAAVTTVSVVVVYVWVVLFGTVVFVVLVVMS